MMSLIKEIYPIWRDVDDHMDMPDGVDMKHRSEQDLC
jgi:hypothetical protein